MEQIRDKISVSTFANDQNYVYVFFSILHEKNLLCLLSNENCSSSKIVFLSFTSQTRNVSPTYLVLMLFQPSLIPRHDCYHYYFIYENISRNKHRWHDPNQNGSHRENDYEHARAHKEWASSSFIHFLPCCWNTEMNERMMPEKHTHLYIHVYLLKKKTEGTMFEEENEETRSTHFSLSLLLYIPTTIIKSTT